MNKPFVIIAAAWIGLMPTTAVAQGSKKNPPAKKGPSQPADRRLSLDQIRKLIAIQTPDSVVAQEIQARGVNGDYGRRDIEQLHLQGAGSETITALTRLMPVATLTVRTEPGASVKLDGGSPAVVAADGTATLSSIDPGRHQVTADKQYFTSGSQFVELKGRETTSIDIKLEWAVGFLSVNTNVADAQIRVSGGPPQAGRITRLAVPVGQATISATAPLRKSVSQTVVVEPGRDTTISLSLIIDDSALAAMANQIHASFRSRSYAVVVQQAGRYFQTGAQDKDVSAEVAISYLEMSNYSAFQEAARRALEAGATLRFEVMHHHLSLGGFGGGTLHNAELAITKDTLIYKPLDRCNLPEFQTSLRDVHLGKRESAILGKGRTASISVIDLDVPEPNNPKKQVNVNLSIGNVPPGLSSTKGFFRDARGKVDAIRQLLQSLVQ